MDIEACFARSLIHVRSEGQVERPALLAIELDPRDIVLGRLLMNKTQGKSESEIETILREQLGTKYREWISRRGALKAAQIVHLLESKCSRNEAG
jgi:hypothetical protein